MGRAPNPGGPQRVTAHVVPRAKPYPDSPEHEEEEKTTIESQWEDEASTTVEEGDVAEKIRQLGGAPRRNQTGVTNTSANALDEPTVDDQHAQLSAITPVRDVARLVITQGNDAGQEVEIRPGKTYTIGRAIDNDVVLTDIAVSRKHFDLRFEDGAWVIVDRGSGNGTVVNGNLEDNPFMLANGDVIEIGNTIFRFDQPNAAARPRETMDVEADDEELSTVAGKPLRHDIMEEPKPALRPQRPKTLPPPTPLRPANASQPPPLGFPPPGPALPQPALPMPQMANRPPLGSSPTMLGDQVGMPMPSMPLPGLPPSNHPPPAMAPANLPGMMPTTIPGQVSPGPRPMYSYPQATEIPPHSVHAQMLLIQTQNRRGDGSTMLVPPTPYDGLPAPPPSYSQPLTKRAKLVLGGIGLAVFAAVATIAIVKSDSAKATPSAGSPLAEDGKKKTEAKVAAKTAPSEPPKVEKVEKTEKTEPPKVTKVEPEKTAAMAEPPKVEEVEPPVEKREPAKVEPPKVEKREPPKKVVKTEPVKRTRRDVRRDPPAPPKRTAVVETPSGGGGANVAAAKVRADNLYRGRKFSEASNVLTSAARTANDDEAKELRRMADTYARLGRTYSQGTAPATQPTDAFEALRQAAEYDNNAGNAFDSEIKTKLAQVAPKAAVKYMAAKKYQAARRAVTVAQQFGASETVKLVVQKLESVAGELYSEAQREWSSDRNSARDKLDMIKSIVDKKSTWYQKAQKLAAGG